MRGAVIDVDGTVVRGTSVVPGAIEAVSRLREAGIDPLFVSNNPIETRAAYAERLRRLGFDVASEDLLTAGSITASNLASEHPEGTIYVIGESGLRTQLSEEGLTLTEEPSRAAVLVASIDREFSYDTLTESLVALSDEGTLFVGTDPDVTIPVGENRVVPGSGAIVRAIAGVSGREPDRMMGKPSETTIEAVRAAIGVPLEDCLVIGDRLDTDLAMGERAGMQSVLVRTGVTDDRAIARSPVEPTHVIDSIAEIEDVLTKL
ncbi:HAD-IIA family hydrolase [Natronorarus salvus]|uniref:HAD-IIA family hydrolase n=1 Tax=Natronorarus salvus TaxID=3117733 RepID=UPI002F2695AB